MRNKFSPLNRQLLVLPWLTLLLNSGQALALFPSSNPSSSPVNPVDLSENLQHPLGLALDSVDC